MRTVRLGELVKTKTHLDLEWQASRIEKIGNKFYYVKSLTGGPLLKFRFGWYTSECGNYKIEFFK